ncbi:MAG: Asp-tRNA(Asn)/Glu-tRNA(Gln) amidotransferase subunit GatC [Pseudomonadales bacterium]|nr:Asp-tRNA(Asn)/Glu-tRNA(Gln) amidotransferase subunit GatC [Candidatus Woesebacteria bacterium]MCB9802104.1 Asp-tRNA(Asn)/Glu-tRNA(Gln) amidotransferase subunit GatC [Pseudomonadales bacterium]
MKRTDTQHIATLAHIPINNDQDKDLTAAFNETLETIKTLQEVKVGGVEPTHQVTGLENVYREDEVHKDTMFTQDQALKNAHRTYQGFIVVPRILEK